MWVYLNNRFLQKASASVSVFDWGFLYGDGLFETVRAYNGKIFLVSRHLDRLSGAADLLELRVPTTKRLEYLLYETLRRNRLSDAILRLTITRGEGLWGALDPVVCKKPTIVIFARHFEGYPDKLYQRGITGTIVAARQNGSFKSTSFQSHVLAKQEAIRKGVSEAILLNAKGYLAEGSASNLFWVKGGTLYTPALETGILAGVTRHLVLELAKAMKIPVKEGWYRQETLLNAEEAFLTNTGFELVSLIVVDQKKLGMGRPGPITKRLHRAFQKRCSKECTVVPINFP